MDFITKLPNSEGFTTVMVVVDRLSKIARVAPLKPGFTAKVVAQKFLNSVVRYHGFPSSIVSDKDPLFLSRFCKQLFESCGTRLLYSIAYHLQTNGQTEVVNRTLEQYLRVFTDAHQAKWSLYLMWAEYCSNTFFRSTIEMSPYEALYGFAVCTISEYVN
ncbi:hypothetical protein S245_029778 [Arachis hypogaea]